MREKVHKTQSYVRSVGDQFPEENVLVTIEGVDENIHEPRHLSLELKLLRAVAQRSFGDRLRLPITITVIFMLWDTECVCLCALWKWGFINNKFTNLLTTSESVDRPFGTAPILSSTFGGSTTSSEASAFACNLRPTQPNPINKTA